jgi:hypothetical protein
LVFKAVCIEAARLLCEAGESQLNADAIVLAAVAPTAREIGVRVTVPIRNNGGGRQQSTMDYWRQDWSNRRRAAVGGSRALHVSFEEDPKVGTETKSEKRRRAMALLASLKKTSVSRF